MYRIEIEAEAEKALRRLPHCELAQAAGIDAAQLSEIESGERSGAPATLRKLAQALHVQPDDLAV